MRSMFKRSVLGAAGAIALLIAAPSARAEDFLSALFGAFSGRPVPQPQSQLTLPFASEGGQSNPQGEARPRSGGGGQAYCVRTCDGRYFPITGSDNQSRA